MNQITQLLINIILSIPDKIMKVELRIAVRILIALDRCADSRILILAKYYDKINKAAK